MRIPSMFNKRTHVDFGIFHIKSGIKFTVGIEKFYRDR